MLQFQVEKAIWAHPQSFLWKCQLITLTLRKSICVSSTIWSPLFGQLPGNSSGIQKEAKQWTGMNFEARNKEWRCPARTAAPAHCANITVLVGNGGVLTRTAAAAAVRCKIYFQARQERGKKYLGKTRIRPEIWKVLFWHASQNSCSQKFPKKFPKSVPKKFPKKCPEKSVQETVSQKSVPTKQGPQTSSLIIFVRFSMD